MVNTSMANLTPSHQAAIVAAAASPGFFFKSVLPTLISVLVLVGVEFASEHSSLAAAIATAPTGVPLSIWLMQQSALKKEKDQKLEDYCYAVIKGVTATLAFALGSYAAARARLGMWMALGCGYASWFVAWVLLSRYA